jgi:hypothetical protein
VLRTDHRAVPDREIRRARAGSPPAASLDGGLLALSACLVAALAGSLYATHRVSTHLVRQAELTSA